jgi:hypothetical protein
VKNPNKREREAFASQHAHVPHKAEPQNRTKITIYFLRTLKTAREQELPSTTRKPESKLKTSSQESTNSHGKPSKGHNLTSANKITSHPTFLEMTSNDKTKPNNTDLLLH